MFIINACRPSSWCSRPGHLHMEMRVIISLAEVADGFYDAVKCQKEGLICLSMPLLPKAFYLSPTFGAKGVTQCRDHSTAPRYTGAMPVTSAGPG